ncbi:MAG TPA: hypothetical protein VI072_04000 [Polyangiaceae bacterium]
MKRDAGSSAASPRSADREERPGVRRRPRQRDDDPIPVASGRFSTAMIMIGALIMLPFSPIGSWIERKGPSPHNVSAWQPGTVSNVRLTVITADYNLLTCASPATVDGARCAYKSEKEVWPPPAAAPLDDNKANVIQPYRTVPDDKLIFVAGLWNDPVVAMRLHREPPGTGPTKKLVRFVLNCEMKFVGKLDDAKLRWSNNANWVDEGEAMVARPQRCELDEPE